jgi:hypothetical protein
MSDLSSSLLPRLQAHRLPDLDLGEGALYPHYDGFSLLNLPAAICRWLGIPTRGARPLTDELLAACGPEVRRVVLLVMDGLGWDMLGRYLQLGLGQPWKERLPDGILSPLTSISPSTTSAALTTLWTGASPAEHGIAGYELWLREYGVVTNMILQSPMSFGGDTGGLRRAGFRPETFLSVPSLGPHFLEYGVQPYAFMHTSIARSGLSEMHLRQVNVYPFRSPGDLWIGLRDLMNERSGERQYIYAYWGDIDNLSHHFGPEDERVALEFDSFTRLLDEACLKGLSAEARRDTLFILTADHGEVATPKLPRFDLRHHPEFTRLLHMAPTGENRMAYLFVRPGQVRAVREYVEATWPGDFDLVPSTQAIRAGLLGPGLPHPRLADRLGDLILAARGSAYLWWADIGNPLLGRHGGLTPTEMLVPFLAFRL